MEQKLYQSIYNDLIAAKGPKEPTRNLVRRGIPEDKAKLLVAEVYKDLKWEMRKVHLWKVIGSGAILGVLGLIAVFGNRLYPIWIALAGIAFIYSLVQFVFAIGVDVGD